MRAVLVGTDVGLDSLYRYSATTILDKLGGNTGNIAFVSAIMNHLVDAVTLLPWHASADEIREKGEVVVLACANQLGPHTDMALQAEILEEAKLPVIALGLGAQADNQGDAIQIQDGTRRWIDVIADHSPTCAPNIGTRGIYTSEQLSKIGHGDRVVVTGCPSNFTNLETDYASDVERRISGPIVRVASALGLPYWPSLARIERQMLDNVERSGGEGIVQHDLGMVQLARGEFEIIDQDVLELARAYYRPHLTCDEFKQWCRTFLKVYGGVHSWMDAARRYDFVVGPRFHGVMLPLQAGVPAGCVAHDSRTLEMCQTMGIPVRWHTEIDDLSIAALPSLFPFDRHDYNSRRQLLLQDYVSLLERSGLSVNPKLTRH